MLLDQDKNMQCNLAYCLLQTHRIEEAKSLLEAVKSSSEDKYMDDESYLKSYERAVSKLIELEQENCPMKVNSDSRNSWNAHNCFPKPCSQSPMILTQPRSPWRLTKTDQRKKIWNGRIVGNSSRKLSFEKNDINSYEYRKIYDHLQQVEVDEIKKNSGWCQNTAAELSMLSQLSKKSWADMVEEDDELLFAGMETLNRENENHNHFPVHYNS